MKNTLSQIPKFLISEEASNILIPLAESISGGVLTKRTDPQYAQKYSRHEAERYSQDV